MMERLIYLDDFSDEINPCEPTLEAWASWLSKPARDYGRKSAAKHGDRFSAAAIELGSDVVVTRQNGKWTFTHSFTAVDEADFFAVRFGEGLGWDGESICGTMSDMIDWLIANEDYTEDREFIACGRWVPDLIVTYHDDTEGKRCTWERKQ